MRALARPPSRGRGRRTHAERQVAKDDVASPRAAERATTPGRRRRSRPRAMPAASRGRAAAPRREPRPRRAARARRSPSRACSCRHRSRQERVHLRLADRDAGAVEAWTPRSAGWPGQRRGRTYLDRCLHARLSSLRVWDDRPPGRHQTVPPRLSGYFMYLRTSSGVRLTPYFGADTWRKRLGEYFDCTP